MNNKLSIKSRLAYLSFIPFITVLYTSYISTSQGKAAEIFWICNVANLSLAIGLFTMNSALIRLSTLWLIIGTPLWIWDNILHGLYFTPQAFVIHIGGVALGVYAARFISHKQKIWIHALAFGLILTLLCRFFAPPELNINISAVVYEPLRTFLPHYYYYMLFNAICYSIGLITLEILLRWVSYIRNPHIRKIHSH